MSQVLMIQKEVMEQELVRLTWCLRLTLSCSLEQECRHIISASQANHVSAIQKVQVGPQSICVLVLSGIGCHGESDGDSHSSQSRKQIHNKHLLILRPTQRDQPGARCVIDPNKASPCR